MSGSTRPISWVRAAHKDFSAFPAVPRERVLQALDLAAEGRMAEIAKPMKGFGPGIFEIALRYRTDAYRVIYAVQLGDDLWVIHAFQKKSKTGIKTPKQDVELIRRRIGRVRELLK